MRHAANPSSGGTLARRRSTSRCRPTAAIEMAKKQVSSSVSPVCNNPSQMASNSFWLLSPVLANSDAIVSKASVALIFPSRFWALVAINSIRGVVIRFRLLRFLGWCRFLAFQRPSRQTARQQAPVQLDGKTDRDAFQNLRGEISLGQLRVRLHHGLPNVK